MNSRSAIHFSAAAIAAGLLFTSAVSAQQLAPAPSPMILPVDPAPLIADTGKGREKFAVEIADDEIERARGLMFRENMAPDHGMLFIYPHEGDLAFWMRNTILPLDLVFIGKDGKVVGVEHGKPYSEESITPGVPSQFVLELNAGVAKKIGLDAGDVIHHPRLGNALQ